MLATDLRPAESGLEEHQPATAATVLAGWIVVATTAGAVVTHRKALP